ncbi:DUF2971 domain-containing protein [Planomicrobium sp. CPCC 101110]|uniref:DUF2971 domain-containing protein n=1 Tax=Planomicrobium sp. CPCC 101110 TaxID=2599619 RepID=UPI0011B51071|nr:DUF2971 domain-containing protein [Planomicrobium sp. CPCC 101110]TWT24892.1 DUF2971 domain-containing protein [Planomicrobium sp. CPCC 101110]
MAEGIGLAEVLEQQFRDNVEKQIRKVHETEQTLYHYTGLPSLMGMMETNQLWMSKGTFLNDSSELVYFSKVLEFVAKKLENRKHTPLWRLYIRELVRVMGLFMEEVKDNGFEVYIFSLSHSQDSLALWYNYAKGEGYNIGFSAEQLFQKVSGFSSGPMLHGYVMYGRKEQEEVLIELLLKTYELVEPYETEEIKKALPDHFFSLIASCAVFFKDPAFKSEEEYRIALMSQKSDEQPNVQFRAQNGVIIPYITVDFQTKLPISHITIGPKNNVDIAKSGMEHYLKWKGYDMDQVSISKSVAALRY